MTVIGNALNFNTSNTIPTAAQLTPAPPAAHTSGFSFGDILDTVNPLQHIPVISGIYRAVTGSQISATSQIAGDTLYSAPFGGVSALIGLASSVTDVAVKQTTGEDITQHALATVNAAVKTVTAPFTNAVNTVSTAQFLPSANAVASNPTVAPVTGDTSKFSAQLANATQAIYHTTPLQHHQHANAQYQRAQAFDNIINKPLVNKSSVKI
jgi:hypothetical protein